MKFDWTQDFKVIFAMPATGKSFMGQKYDNVLDLSTSRFHYSDYNESDTEKEKGSYNVINPDWPKNYIDALDDALQKYSLILTPGSKGMDGNALVHLTNSGIKFGIAVRENGKEVFAAIAASRGNDGDFINWALSDYDAYIDYMNRFDAVRIKLTPGEYLEQALTRYEAANKKSGGKKK